MAASGESQTLAKRRVSACCLASQKKIRRLNPAYEHFSWACEIWDGLKGAMW